MGLLARTTVKAGPFRFTASRSGLTISAGVPGFRVGSGPRGNYVSVGGGGVRYRTSVRTSSGQQPMPAVRSPERESQVVMADTSGATALELAPSSGDDLVTQLNAASRYRGLAWWAVAATLVVGATLGHWWWTAWITGAPMCWWLFLRDRARRSVVVFYDVQDTPAAWFERLVTCWPWLSESRRVWRQLQSGRVETTYQHKTNAGAGTLVSRQVLQASLTGPRHLATNVDVPSLTAGKSALYFLPDRLLVREGKSYTDIAYVRLHVAAGTERFIESPRDVPSDARLVDHTWQYVNVKGGPDRRFKDNPQLPVMRYGTIQLTTSDGLAWLVQTSRELAAAEVAAALTARPLISEAG